MKVLYVVDSFPKLSETFILNEIVELIRRGIDVKILALRKQVERTINEDILSNNLVDITRYFHLPVPSELEFRHCISPLFYYCMLKTFYMYHADATFKHLVRLSYFIPYYRDVDIVHAHFAYEAAIAGMHIGNVLGKPFTFTAHAYEIFSRSAYSKERLMALADSAEKIITPSAFNKNYIMKETHCAEDKIEIVRATICAEKFNNNKPRKTAEDTIKIIAIGRLVEKKGFEYLIRAMKTVMKGNSSVTLNIIGEGKLKKELIKLSNNLSLAGCVNILGERSNEYCAQELSNSDIAVLPCVVATDGDLDVCPLTLQEAMAMEIPVVSTTVGSIPELIEDGKEGFLVPERNEKALADAILKLINNPSQREKMGKKGREKILREFNIKTQVDKLLEIWKKIVDHNMENTHSE
jgi:glycosyltransferase involved in cell wall biosynthesis